MRSATCISIALTMRRCIRANKPPTQVRVLSVRRSHRLQTPPLVLRQPLRPAPRDAFYLPRSAMASWARMPQSPAVAVLHKPELNCRYDDAALEQSSAASVLALVEYVHVAYPILGRAARVARVPILSLCLTFSCIP